MTIPLNIMPVDNSSVVLQDTGAGASGSSYLDPNINTLPCASGRSYSVSTGNVGTSTISNNGVTSFPGTSAGYPNFNLYRSSQSFAPPVVTVPPNHVSPTVSDGHNSVSSQPTQQSLWNQSVSEDLVTRNGPNPETEKSPHVFTSVRLFFT